MSNDPYKRMMEALEKSRDMLKKYIWVGIVLVIIVITWYYKREIGKDSNNNVKIKKIYKSKTYASQISNITSGNGQFKFSDKEGTGHLRDYYIASSCNSCCGGDFQNDFVSLEPLKEIIFSGSRLLDFEIYSVNDDLVVAASGSESPYLKGTYNSISLGGAGGVLQTIRRYAFAGGTCPNPRDPLFINLRIKTNKNHYDKLAKYVSEAFSGYLLNAEYGYEGRSDAPGGGINLANEKILDLAGTDYRKPKVIIICDQANRNYRGTKFEELINLSGDSAYLQIKRNKDLINTHFVKGMEDFNKTSLTLVLPDLTNINDNMSPSLAFSYGCQMCCMNYQNMDEGMKKYFKKFNDAGSAFVLKPKRLRLIAPPTIKPPPPQNPKLTYAPKKIALPMYKTDI